MDKYLLYNENGISYFKGTHPAKITFGGLLPEILSVGRKYTYFHNDIEMKGYWPTHSPIQYNLNIPYSVKEIAERSFWGFSIYDQKNELTGETNRYYDNYGAIVKVRMGKNVRKIGYRAFFNCGFTKLMLPRILRRARRQIIHLRGGRKTLPRSVFTVVLR